MLLHTDTFPRRCFYTQTLLHTEALIDKGLTHRHVYTQMLLHTEGCAGFTSAFDDRTSFHGKGLRRKQENCHFTSSFDGRTSFREKGLRRKQENRNFTSLLTVELHFVRKSCAGCKKIAILPYLTVKPHFAKGLRRTPENRNFTSAFDDRTSFRAKALRRTLENHNFTSAFDDRISFRAKGLHFVAPRWHRASRKK